MIGGLSGFVFLYTELGALWTATRKNMAAVGVAEAKGCIFQGCFLMAFGLFQWSLVVLVAFGSQRGDS